MDLHRYLQVLRRHRGLVAVITLLGLAAGALASFASTPRYAAAADVLLLPTGAAEQRDESAVYALDPGRYADMQMAIMTSPRLLAEAAQAADATPAELRAAITVGTGATDDVVVVRAEDGSARRAAAMANALADTYVADRQDAVVGDLRTAATELQTELDALQARIGALQGEVNARRVGGADGFDADLEAAVEQYKALYARQQDLLIEANLKANVAEVIQPATVDEAPIGLGLARSTVLGGLLGLVVGLGLAVLRDELDDRLRSREDVEAVAGLPVLAELPVDRGSARRPGQVATAADPLGPLAEASRSLRTTVGFFAVDDRPVRRLLVTSPVPGEGKTLVASNLAVAYAQAGYRTVLVSADLRRPSAASRFGLEDERRGLTDLFGQGAVALRDPDGRLLDEQLAAVLQPTGIQHLTLLPAGPVPPNPAEILASRRMAHILDRLAVDHDVVLVDTSPALAVSDAAALSADVGEVLVVVSMGASRRRQLARTLDTFRHGQARVLGVVVNKVKGEHVEYGSGYLPRPTATTHEEVVDDQPARRSKGASTPVAAGAGRNGRR